MLTFLPLIAMAFFFIIIAVLIVGLFKRLLVNAVLGVIALLVINHYGAEYGISVALNVITFAICAFLGLAGAGLLILLSLLGVIIV